MTDDTLQSFEDAQRRGQDILRACMEQLEEGMSERDLDAICRDLARREGAKTWFHPPEIQFGARTLSHAVWRNPSSSSKLKRGDLVVMDIAPAWDHAYADVGTTVAFGMEEEPELIQVARSCLRATLGFASQWKTVGELYIYARAWAVNHRLTLQSSRSIGHAILPLEGWHSSPLKAHTTTWLRRYQVRRLNPTRIRGMWAVCPLISDGVQAASFREILYIQDEEERVLGRNSLDEIGTL